MVFSGHIGGRRTVSRRKTTVNFHLLSRMGHRCSRNLKCSCRAGHELLQDLSVIETCRIIYGLLFEVNETTTASYLNETDLETLGGLFYLCDTVSWIETVRSVFTECYSGRY